MPCRPSMCNFLSCRGQIGFALWPNEVAPMACKKFWRHYSIDLASIQCGFCVNSTKCWRQNSCLSARGKFSGRTGNQFGRTDICGCPHDRSRLDGRRDELGPTQGRTWASAGKRGGGVGFQSVPLRSALTPSKVAGRLHGLWSAPGSRGLPIRNRRGRKSRSKGKIWTVRKYTQALAAKK